MSPTAGSSSSQGSSSACASSSSSSPSAASAVDAQAAALKWYGHEETARTAASYIMHLFHCPNIPAPSASSAVRPPLANFVAYALYRTQLPPSVTTCALLLLSRLKARYPSARGSSGHRLFISAFMMSSKMNCDDTYSNKSWAIVAQNMFPLAEINQMEREMLGYLEWHVDVGLEQMEELQRTLDGVFNAFRLPPAPAAAAAAAAGSTSSSAAPSSSSAAAAPRYTPYQHQQQQQPFQLPTPASSTASSPLAPNSAAAAPAASTSAGHSPAFQAHAGPSFATSNSSSSSSIAQQQQPSYPSPPYSPCASLDFGASAASTPCSSNASPYECRTPPNGQAPQAAGGHPTTTTTTGGGGGGGSAKGPHPTMTTAATATTTATSHGGSSGFDCWSAADVQVV